MLIPRRAWEELSGFDPQFELYYEDVDLCRRAAAFGGVWLSPIRAGTHEGGEAAGRNARRAFIANGVSRVRYLRKWHGRPGVAAALTAGAIELVARTLARRRNTLAVRWEALAAQVREARRPGTVCVLNADAER
jgi:GT2 family glycosyltransferase